MASEHDTDFEPSVCIRREELIRQEMEAAEDQANCWRCGSPRRIDLRQAFNHNSSFGPQYELIDSKSFAPSLVHPYLHIGSLQVCVECGFVWSAVDPEAVVEKVRVWGTDELKRRVLNQLPLPAAPPDGGPRDASSLPRTGRADRDAADRG
jgi:hypothetical protein